MRNETFNVRHANKSCHAVTLRRAEESSEDRLDRNESIMKQTFVTFDCFN